MILRLIRERKEFKRRKVDYYRWIREKNIEKLKELFSDPEFYKLPKTACFSSHTPQRLQLRTKL